MPQALDPNVKERCGLWVLEQARRTRNPTPVAAAEAVAKGNRIGTESVRRRYADAVLERRSMPSIA